MGALGEATILTFLVDNLQARKEGDVMARILVAVIVILYSAPAHSGQVNELRYGVSLNFSNDFVTCMTPAIAVRELSYITKSPFKVWVGYMHHTYNNLSGDCYRARTTMIPIDVVRDGSGREITFSDSDGDRWRIVKMLPTRLSAAGHRQIQRRTGDVFVYLLTHLKFIGKDGKNSHTAGRRI